MKMLFFQLKSSSYLLSLALSSVKVDVNKELKEEESNPGGGGEATRAYSIFPSDKRKERKKETLANFKSIFLSKVV